MADNKIETEKMIEYWTNSSDTDFDTMTDMFKTKHYHWSLFIGHLVIEKLSKALYVKLKQDFPPLIHDIRRIQEKAGVSLTKEQIVVFDTISRFNINARYDDYKQRFYKLCTKEFTIKWINEIKETREWIKKMLLE